MSFGIPYGASFTGANGKSYRASMSGERYVYYKRLETDGYKELFNKAVSVLDYRVDYVGGNAKSIAEYFFKLRDGELEKEQALLLEKFGINVSSYENKDGDTVGAELIKAFNKTLNLKSVFERNLALIKNTKGQKQLITFFFHYFEDQWDANANIISKEIFQAFKGNKEKTFLEIAAPIINGWVPKLVREALIYMFEKAGAESGIGEEYQSAYKDLLGPLKDMSNNLGNSFIQSFYQAYGLDRLTENIIEQLNENEKAQKNLKDFKLSAKMNIHSKGGLASENLENYIANFMLSQLGAKGYSTQTGASEIKADTIITFNMPESIIENWLNSNIFSSSVSRERNVQAINQLQAQLEEFDNGFIVYTNAKNYTLNDGFRGRGGFSAGTELKLQDWDSMMHAVNQKGRDLIFSAMQLIPGAIGDGKKEAVSNMYARAIASALFDDFDAIGTVEESGAASIHLLYLNGIYFPLSFFFDLLAEAFNDYSEASVSDIVKVSFQIPTSILFKKAEDQSAWQKAHKGESAWREQQQDALENIKVSYHFLKAYKKIMSRLNLEDTF